MRTSTGAAGVGWRIANVAAALLFFASAAVQLDDPDPLPWVAVYVAAGAACLVARAPWSWRLAAAVGLVALVWALALAPRALPGLVFSDLVRPMHDERPRIELGRELLGLLVTAGWMAARVAVEWRRRRAAAGRPDAG